MSGIFTIKRSGPHYMFDLALVKSDAVIFTSEGYPSLQSAEEGIAAVKAQAASERNYNRTLALTGQPYFMLMDPAGSVLGAGGLLASARALDDAIELVKLYAGPAPVRHAQCPAGAFPPGG